MGFEFNREDLEIHQYEELCVEALRNKEGLKRLKLACSLLEALDVSYWVSAGTMLGLYRDGGLIPHDTDIDVETMDTHRAEDIKKAFSENNYKLVREVFYKKIPMQIAFASLSDNIIFDIYLYVKYDEDTIINYSDSGVLQLPYGFIQNKRISMFKGVAVPVPYSTEEYLTYRFGNWMEPEKTKGGWADGATNLIKYDKL